MRRMTFICVSLAAVLAGCGSETSATPAPTAAATPRTQLSVPYLLRDERVAPVARRVPATNAVAATALRQLLAGPTAAEAASGYTTAIPPATRLRGITIRSGTATVDLTRAFESGGGSLSMQARVAQVVHTLTRFPSIKRVAFKLGGRPVSSIGGEGVIVRPPVDRTEFEAVAPPILVESPLPGDRVRSPLKLRGTANTFEATFQVELLGPAGKPIAHRTIMATSGTGTRGKFIARLRFRARAGTKLVLHAYENSAANGAVIHSVRVPLVAGAPRPAVGKQPAPDAAIRAARARASELVGSSARLGATLRSQVDPAWSLVTGGYGKRGLWAAWVRRDSAGGYRVEIFRTRNFAPGPRPPCDIRPAFAEPVC
jgi:sporulation and spore germination protein/immunoglobulin-like protein involved in spore germination